MSEYRETEQLAAWWRGRYVRGEVEASEMEAGIDRALRGDFTEAEYVEACRDAAVRRAFTEPMTLSTVDSILKTMYAGPIA